MALFLQFLTQEWILVLALLVVAAMLAWHEARKAGPSITPQQAINLINGEQGVFVDLRDNADFRQGHIIDTLHIPSSKLEERMAELVKYKEKPVVLVCKLGQQSGVASKQLKAAGFSRVYKMTGGMTEWSNLQLPVTSKS
jgi:rhodanese-related sulfurtransferase